MPAVLNTRVAHLGLHAIGKLIDDAGGWPSTDKTRVGFGPQPQKKIEGSTAGESRVNKS